MEITPSLIKSIAAKVSETLSQQRNPVENSPLPSFGGYHEAAAVLGWFSTRTIKPTRGTIAKDSIDDLLAHSMLLNSGNSDRCWTILPDVRILTLRQLRESHRVSLALEANKPHHDDRIEQSLRAYLSTRPPEVTNKSLEELGVLYQVGYWLREAGFLGIPDPIEIFRRIEWLTLLQPFEHLAGDKHFRGRKLEIKKIREYVGILPPSTHSERIERFIRQTLKFERKPPFLIFGIGGVGKSALVARFILEHARAHEKDRFPFAYLDFDRPDIETSVPLSLLMEAVRQFGIQYPEAQQQCEHIRKRWSNLLRESISTSKSGNKPKRALSELGPYGSIVSVTISEFARLIESLGERDRPILLVLDTFEEAQWRGEEKVSAIWEMIEALQNSIPKIRVVVVGRAQITGQNTISLPLGNLDHEASLGYLAAHGISGPISKRLADLTNGNPLSLRLAIELVKDKEFKTTWLEGIQSHRLLWKLQDGDIQRQLYARILDHIHDEDIRKLAHPGLVLRRVTPELILRVLAKPCDLTVTSLDEAKELFERLQCEVSLVSLDSDGALVHRPDLRLLMVNLLRMDNPFKVRIIHEHAVNFYENLAINPINRGEEIYHRLWLGHETSLIDSRWISGVEGQLFGALEEFSGTQKAYLASRLNVEIDEVTRSTANLEDWERIIERKVLDLIGYGQLSEALDLIRSRSERTSSSPLYSLEAAVLEKLGQCDESMQTLFHGLESAYASGANREQTLGLGISIADLIMRSGHGTQIPRALKWLEELLEHKFSPKDRLALLVRQALLSKHVTMGNVDLPTITGKSWELFDALGDEQISEQNQLSFLVGMTLETNDSMRLARIFRVSGLPRRNPEVIRTLASEVTSFDVLISKRINKPPGYLARSLDLPTRNSLTATWAEFLLEGQDIEVRRILNRLLTDHRDSIPSRLFEAFQAILFQALDFRMNFKPGGTPIQAKSTHLEETPFLKGVRLTEPQRAKLSQAFIEAFSSPEALREFLHYRLNRSFDTITLAQSLEEIVFSLISDAEAEGWLVTLIAKAREAHPLHAKLAEIANEVGLSILLPDKPTLERFLKSSPSFSLVDWKEKLSKIEGQVCQVEVGKRMYGTGFLVGSNLLLTANYLIDDVRNLTIPSTDVTLRFDYKEFSGEGIVNAGTTFTLETDWLVKHSQIGYALLRVSDSPGSQPVGGGLVESMPTLRQWIEIPVSLPVLETLEDIFIVQHPEGRPLRLTIGKMAVSSFDQVGVEILYNVPTFSGSGGAPCFNQNFDLVALHLGRKDKTDVAFGVTIGAILHDLEQSGLGGILEARFA